MGRYYDVRGWISCSFDDVDQIKRIIESVGTASQYWSGESERLDLYQSGWLYQSRILNWTGHVFYGGSLRSDGVELVLECLREVAAAVAEVEGLFFVDDDDGERREVWNLAGGQVMISERATEVE